MVRLTARLVRVETRLGAPPRCPDPWHGNAITPRTLDYRHAIAPLLPPSVAPPGPEVAPPADRCPSCGASRPRIEIVAVDYGPAASPGVGGRLWALHPDTPAPAQEETP